MLQAKAEEAAPVADVPMADVDDMDADPEMAMALQMSMQQTAPSAEPPASEAAPAPAAAGLPENNLFQDAAFMQSVLGSLPGVDATDPRFQGVLGQASGDANKEGKEEEKDKDKEGE